MACSACFLLFFPRMSGRNPRHWRGECENQKGKNEKQHIHGMDDGVTSGHDKQAQQQIGKQKESGTQAETKRLPGRTEGGEEQNRCVNGNSQNRISVLFKEEPDHSSGTGSGKNCPENPAPPAHLSAALEQQDEGKVEKQKTHDACRKMD